MATITDRFVLGMIFGCSVSLWTTAFPALARLTDGRVDEVVIGFGFTAGLIGIGWLGSRPWLSPCDRPWFR